MDYDNNAFSLMNFAGSGGMPLFTDAPRAGGLAQGARETYPSLEKCP